MQIDATLQLPDGKQIPVVVELDATELESSLSDTAVAEVVARAIEDQVRKRARWPGCVLL